MPHLATWLVALTLSSQAFSEELPKSPVQLGAGVEMESSSIYSDPYASEIYSEDVFATDSLIRESLMGSDAFETPDYLSVKPLPMTGLTEVPYFSIPDMDAPAPKPRTVDPESELPLGYSTSRALENYFPDLRNK